MIIFSIISFLCELSNLQVRNLRYFYQIDCFSRLNLIFYSYFYFYLFFISWFYCLSFTVILFSYFSYFHLLWLYFFNLKQKKLQIMCPNLLALIFSLFLLFLQVSFELFFVFHHVLFFQHLFIIIQVLLSPLNLKFSRTILNRTSIMNLIKFN